MKHRKGLLICDGISGTTSLVLLFIDARLGSRLDSRPDSRVLVDVSSLPVRNSESSGDSVCTPTEFVTTIRLDLLLGVPSSSLSSRTLFLLNGAGVTGSVFPFLLNGSGVTGSMWSVWSVFLPT